MARRHIRYGLALGFAIFLTAGCDNDPGSTPPGTPVQVAGNERFGWTQSGDSSQVVQAFRFALYLDGVRSILGNAQCGTQRVGDGYTCTAPLPAMSPGRHSIGLVAIDRASESPMSRLLELNVVPRATASNGLGETAGALERTCEVSSPKRACYAVDVLAQGLSEPSGLVVVGDDRLLLVDRRTDVLLIDGDRVELAYRVPHDSQQRLHSIALGPQFERTRQVYLAVEAPRAEGRTLSIVSLREVGGTLGEAATIVPDLPMTTSGEAALTMGTDSLLYVALPGVADSTPTAGFVLRFDSSGAAKGRARLASSLLAVSNARPTRLAWQNDGLWIAGLGLVSPSVLGLVSPTDTESSAEWPLRPRAVHLTGLSASRGILDLAPAGTQTRGSSGFFMILEEPRELYRATVTEARGRAVATVTSIPLGPVWPTSIAVAPSGTIYIAATGAAADVAQGIVLRLRPEATTQAVPR